MDIINEFKKNKSKNGVIKGFCLLLFCILHKGLERLLICLYKSCFPINQKLLLFKSTPDYSDNARAITDYMIEKGYTNRYVVFFDVLDPKSYNKIYSHLPIKFFSSRNTNGTYKLSSLKLLYTAKFLLSTHEMILNCYRGRKEQHFIRLWHGCGYKDRSSRDGKGKRNFDIALVPGPLFIKTKAHFWNVDEKFIVAKGYPRYDWLLVKDSKALLIQKTLKYADDDKIILWMPTYRVDKNGRFNDTHDLADFPILNSTEDWIELDEHCKSNRVIILLKLHPFQKRYSIPFDKVNYIKEISSSVFESESVPFYSFLPLTDALITDYSSVAFDYLLVDKPIGFTLDDYDAYKNLRGFVFDNPLEYMPGHQMYTKNDLKQFVKDVSTHTDMYKDERCKIRNVAISPSTHYCKDLLDYLGIV